MVHDGKIKRDRGRNSNAVHMAGTMPKSHQLDENWEECRRGRLDKNCCGVLVNVEPAGFGAAVARNISRIVNDSAY